MGSNAKLRKADKAKNDEFYTQLADIENELSHYKEFLRGKLFFVIVMIHTKATSSNISQ